MNQTIATRQRFWLVFLLFLHTVNTYMDRVCISAAKGSMQEDIVGLDDQMMGYVFGIFAIGYALFQIPAGWFSDRAGPRRALTIVVLVWSIFTALTGAVSTAISLLVVRFLFGVGEAGAYPGATRALYSWLPANERGIGQGIFHSGARIGAALSLVLMPWLIDQIGWRMTFVANGVLGLIWGGVWWIWYRDLPANHRRVNQAELGLIHDGIEGEQAARSAVPYIQIVTSANVLLAMFQYAASNMTFFISITWLQPYLSQTFGESYAYLASLPLLCGAVALWVSGYAVTGLHRRGMHVWSRRLPAIVGYTLGALGLLLTTQLGPSASVWTFIACFSLATFGVEMTLSPSWAFCMDVGGARSGAVSAAMNMVGNLGAAVSAVAFPFFVAHVTLPVIAESTGTANSFFAFAAMMNVLAVVAWMFMNPQRPLTKLSAAALRRRVVWFVLLILAVVGMLVYSKFLLPSSQKKQASHLESPASERVGWQTWEVSRWEC
ncbi:MFS transporter [Roseiconus nitratireducens]|uniref:MFS transporter n=1 Tax=Roseiconus nitratireducens TaxID=2605748 RepID=A0A5M6D2R8_9BACT|nr:MFS transporter [Roseiconus nitratireducens]KAA5541761.1 MFS transporter [Roseiconus nitratireducens]